jgi:hypothetical protein
MSDIAQHPLREDLSKFSPDGLRTFMWNELDKPPIELLQMVERLRTDDPEKFELYFSVIRDEMGLLTYRLRNPFRSGVLKFKKNHCSNPLASVFKQYNKDWVYTINGFDNILMRAEIPLAHLDKVGSKYYANIFVKLMSCDYPEKYWSETFKTDTSLVSEWLFCTAGIVGEFLIVYYLKPALWEIDRQYLFEGFLRIGNKDWKEDFLNREKHISHIRSVLNNFTISERQYAGFANAFEFAFQVENFIDDISTGDRFNSVEQLVKYGLKLSISQSCNYVDKLLSHRHTLKIMTKDENSFSEKYKNMIEILIEKEKAKWTDIIVHDKKQTQFNYNTNDYE